VLNKPLAEEQEDMRSRWSDPAYRWEHDSALRRRYLKEINEKVPASRHNVETTLRGSSETVE